jgi:hypothetical protein
MQHTSCPLCKADFNRNSDLNAWVKIALSLLLYILPLQGL